MTFDIEIVLRERDIAIAERLEHAGNEPRRWNEQDVEAVLRSMLRAIDRAKNPATPAAHVALRGFSWIVEPAPGGVVIAIEIPMGAAVAGPFEIGQQVLDRLISQVLASSPPTPSVVH